MYKLLEFKNYYALEFLLLVKHINYKYYSIKKYTI